MKRNLFRNRFSEESPGLTDRVESKPVYHHIRAEGKPTTEWGVGNYMELQVAGVKYASALPRRGSFVLIQLRDKNSDLGAIAKIDAPSHHDDVSSGWLQYVADVQGGLIYAMKQQRPDAVVRGSVRLCKSRDEGILNMLSRYAAREEVVKHEVYRVKK